MIEISQSAYVLHTRPFRDNQVIVDFLTELDGKVSVITYVGSSLKSNKKSLLQPFLPLTIMLSGNQQLKKLKSIESDKRSFRLVANYLYSGFYLNELMVRLLPELINCETLFQQYHVSLEALNNQQTIEPILRSFELILLDELGLSLDFSPIFEIETGGNDETRNAHQYFSFDPDLGFVFVGNKPLKLSYEKTALVNIAQNNYDSPETLLCFKKLMRHIFDQLLGNKPLHSRSLFVKR